MASSSPNIEDGYIPVAAGPSDQNMDNHEKNKCGQNDKNSDTKFQGIDLTWETNKDDLYDEALEKYEYFWKADSPFSQCYYSCFFLDDIKFTCAEQYMMYEKAILFGDSENANKILKEKSPEKMIAHGRQVHGFSDEVWNANCLSIVKKANIAKFSQHKRIKKILFRTHPKIIVEASPLDAIWGIGLAEDEPDAWDEARWRGKNYLGYILTEVRDELMADEGKISKADKKIMASSSPNIEDGYIPVAAGPSDQNMDNHEKNKCGQNDKNSDTKFQGIDLTWETNKDDLYDEALEKYEYFWKADSPFSQCYYSCFFLDDIKFTCAEQYMMYEKAILFGDSENANKILKEKSPEKMIAHGRQVHGFSDEVWNANCLSIVKKANIAKFSQHKRIKKILFKTHPKLIVEASPLDAIWGIGLAEDQPDAWDEARWRGKNYLGYILTEVRDELMADEGEISKADKKVYIPDLKNQLRKEKESVNLPEESEMGSAV